MVFGMPSALFPAFALHRLGGNAATVGYLYAAPYAGALVGSLVSGWTSHVRRQGLGVTVAACAWGAAIAGFGLHDDALAGARSARGRGRRRLLQRRPAEHDAAPLDPDHLRGRLQGIEFMQVASAPNLGDLEAGVLASLTSLRFSVVSGGVLCVVGCVATALALPRFSRLRQS